MNGIAGYLVTGLVSLFTGALLLRLKQNFDPTARLYWADTHVFAFSAANVGITTRSVLIENNGKAAANAVEVVHTSRPAHFQLYPPRNFTEVTLADGHHVISLGTLAPKEGVMVHMLAVQHGAVPQLPTTVLVRGSGIVSVKVAAAPQRVWPRGFRRFLLASLFTGWFAMLAAIVWFGWRVGIAINLW